jgi:hypothetical protein
MDGRVLRPMAPGQPSHPAAACHAGDARLLQAITHATTAGEHFTTAAAELRTALALVRTCVQADDQDSKTA